MLKSTLLKATQAGAKVLQEYFNGTFTISHKDTINNLVTEADQKAEAAIIAAIREDYPTTIFSARKLASSARIPLSNGSSTRSTGP